MADKPNSDHPEGKSYVVFGKKDNTNAVNISSVSSGSGGCVINGKDTSHLYQPCQTQRKIYLHFPCRQGLHY
jgi:hypothetical protein